MAGEVTPVEALRESLERQRRVVAAAKELATQRVVAAPSEGETGGVAEPEGGAR